MKLSSFDFRIDPTADGYDHIRIHPKAVTSLGRYLCHAAHTSFTHPKFGTFASMEAYWQWVRTGMRHDALRELHGHKAVKIGMRYLAVQNKNFHALIIEGLKAKIAQHSKIQDLLILSDIPIIQYNDELGNGDFMLDHNHDWYFDALHEIRKEYQAVLSKRHKKLPFKAAQLLEESLLGLLPRTLSPA